MAQINEIFTVMGAHADLIFEHVPQHGDLILVKSRELIRKLRAVEAAAGGYITAPCSPSATPAPKLDWTLELARVAGRPKAIDAYPGSFDELRSALLRLKRTIPRVEERAREEQLLVGTHIDVSPGGLIVGRPASGSVSGSDKPSQLDPTDVSSPQLTSVQLSSPLSPLPSRSPTPPPDPLPTPKTGPATHEEQLTASPSTDGPNSPAELDAPHASSIQSLNYPEQPILSSPEVVGTPLGASEIQAPAENPNLASNVPTPQSTSSESESCSGQQPHPTVLPTPQDTPQDDEGWSRKRLRSRVNNAREPGNDANELNDEAQEPFASPGEKRKRGRPQKEAKSLFELAQTVGPKECVNEMRDAISRSTQTNDENIARNQLHGVDVTGRFTAFHAQMIQSVPDALRRVRGRKRHERLSRFWDQFELGWIHGVYSAAQNNPEEYLRELDKILTPKAAKPGRKDTAVKQRFADLIISVLESDESEDENRGGDSREERRKRVLNLVKNWRHVGKRSFLLMQRFGIAILVLLPEELTKTNLLYQRMKDLTDSKFSHLSELIEDRLPEFQGLLAEANSLLEETLFNRINVGFAEELGIAVLGGASAYRNETRAVIETRNGRLASQAPSPRLADNSPVVGFAGRDISFRSRAVNPRLLELQSSPLYPLDQVINSTYIPTPLPASAGLEPDILDRLLALIISDIAGDRERSLGVEEFHIWPSARVKESAEKDDVASWSPVIYDAAPNSSRYQMLPSFIQDHWQLAVFDTNDHVIRLYDPMSPVGMESFVFSALQNWLNSSGCNPDRHNYSTKIVKETPPASRVEDTGIILLWVVRQMLHSNTLCAVWPDWVEERIRTQELLKKVKRF